MTHCVMLLALLLAQGVPNQVVSPVGRPTTSAINIQVDPAHPIPTTATVNVAGAADLAGNTATFNANNVCTSVITAGEQSVGFHLTAGTLDATLTAYITNQVAAINCATAGTCTSVAFSSGATIVVTNPNGVKDVGVSVVSTRQVQVCTTTYASGSATGVVTATYLQAASAGGGGGGAVTQATDPWLVAGKGTAGTPSGGVVTIQGVTSMTPVKVDGSGVTQPVSAASLPLPTGASTEATLALIKAKTDNLDVLLSTRTKPADTQAVSAASLPLPTGAATDATLTGGTQKAIVRGGAKGATTAADVTSTANGADHQGLDVQVQNTVPVSGPLTDTQLRASAVPISAASLPLPTGAATEATLAGVKTGTDKIPASPSTDRTTAAAPFSVRLSDGAAFFDPRDISDRVGRALGVVSITGSVAVTGTFWQATQPVSIAAALDVSDRLARVLGHVICDSGCTPGGSFSDNTAFTAGTTAISIDGGEFNDTPLADVPSGNAAGLRITKQRAVHVNLRDSLGNEVTSLGSSGQITDGAGTTNKATVLPGYQSADGTDAALVVKLSPDSKINFVNIGAKTVNNSVGYNPLTAPTIKTQLVDPSGRPATVLGPNRAPIGYENAVVIAQSPVPAPICPNNAALSQTTSTTVIPGLAGKLTYVCKVFLVSTTAQSISITEGTGSACGTLPTALAGSTTVANGMGLAANAGWVEGTGAGIVYTAQKVGDDICVLQSGAGNVAGSISYVQRSTQ